jgi:hypothetical protein
MSFLKTFNDNIRKFPNKVAMALYLQSLGLHHGNYVAS